MSVKTTAKVWEWSKAEGNARLVLLAISDFTDDDGYCWPGIARIAKKCRLSERTVQRCIRELESIGELVVEQGAGKETRGGFTSRYLVKVTGCQIDGGSPDPVTKQARPGDKTGNDPVTALSPESSIEPSKNRHTEFASLIPSSKLETKERKVRKGTVGEKKPEIQEMKDFAESQGFPASDGEALWYALDAKGWKGVKNWQSTFHTYRLNSWLVSQKQAVPVAGKPPLSKAEELRRKRGF